MLELIRGYINVIRYRIRIVTVQKGGNKKSGKQRTTEDNKKIQK